MFLFQELQSAKLTAWNRNITAGRKRKASHAGAGGAREPRGPTQADGEASDYLTTTFIRICVGWIVQMTVKVPRLLNLCE
jgi:hypothetical protein